MELFTPLVKFVTFYALMKKKNYVTLAGVLEFLSFYADLENHSTGQSYEEITSSWSY